MKTTVSEKGQITIPKPLRDKLGLVSGTVLDFEAESWRLIGRKRLASDAFRKWRGSCRLPKGMSVDGCLGEVRG
jgi:AbrB family looped-hinge helix DNA binding protein